MNKTVTLVFGLVLALRGAAGAAVVTSPSDAAVTVLASAFISSDGTVVAQDGAGSVRSSSPVMASTNSR